MKESNFKKKVAKDCKALPNSHIIKIHQVAIHGTPDYILFLNGFVIMLELKKSRTARTSELQIYHMGKINAAGCIAIKVYPENWDVVYIVLQKLSRRVARRLPIIENLLALT